MNGPQHYRMAEQAVEYACSGEATDPDMTVAIAQVHATLALTAATAPVGLDTAAIGAWAEAIA
jgi:hypothetical protein